MEGQIENAGSKGHDDDSVAHGKKETGPPDDPPFPDGLEPENGVDGRQMIGIETVAEPHSQSQQNEENASGRASRGMEKGKVFAGQTIR